MRSACSPPVASLGASRSRSSLGASQVSLPPKTPASLAAAHTADMMKRSRQAIVEGLDAEMTAKRRVNRLRRDLARSRSEAALNDVRDRNRARVMAAKAEYEALRGAHLKGVQGSVPPASDAEVRALALQMVEHMERTEVDPSNRGWYVLFKRMDVNKDGLITYAELIECIRGSMRLDKEMLPEAKVQAVWNSIDMDGNGWIDCAEFGRFFRQGEQAHAPVRESRRQKKILRESRTQAEAEMRIASQGGGDEEAVRARASALRLENEARNLESALSSMKVRGGASTRSSLGALSLPPLH